MAGCRASWIATVAAVAIMLLLGAVNAVPTRYPSLRCSTNAPPRNILKANSETLRVGNRPWGIAYLNDDYAFAVVNFSLAVIDTTNFKPKLRVLIPLPPLFAPGTDMGNDDPMSDGYGYRELTFSHDKYNLYIATGYGAVIIDTVRAIQARTNAVVGTLSSNGYAGRSAIELSVTPDDKYIFISQEFGSDNTEGRGAIEVFNVTRLDDGTVISSYRGYVPLAYATVGQKFSSDYTKLFVVSEIDNTTASVNDTAGVLSVLDVAKLRRTPKQALIAEIATGCRPSRCDMADGKHLWVTERDANQVSVFDAEKLMGNRTNATDVLVATVNTGTSPIGIAVAGGYILTADSNRFNYTNATTGVTVVNTATALLGEVDFPQIPTGEFPRSLAVSPSGNTLLVSEFGAGNIRAVDISFLKKL
ncbi:uncharacterized protein JN550_008136 [Neoarthrinium moseri]|uniref:uncharacterized protein n=1 Tax=Neoarthrinium moseri TaxID=1658444 RepID=UPI001FDCDCB5|nr:uncharacterized protein JN550_008136 [Neoarthrinium moseri]KAI1865878.1 hypothetical protein JN550_008136 [Neoarthrinium moseri]